MYMKEKHTLELHHRPLWPWIVEQLEDPRLAPYLSWDDRMLFRYEGTCWVNFVDEPFTAVRAWNVQVRDIQSQLVVDIY